MVTIINQLGPSSEFERTRNSINGQIFKAKLKTVYNENQRMMSKLCSIHNRKNMLNRENTPISLNKRYKTMEQ